MKVQVQSLTEAPFFFNQSGQKNKDRPTQRDKSNIRINTFQHSTFNAPGSMMVNQDHATQH